MRLAGLVLGWMLVLGLGTGIAPAQVAAGMGTQSGELPRTVEAALHAMSDRAAVVFVGTVLEVRRGVAPGSRSGSGTGVVEIEFAVEQAVRGCAAGGTYTLREWAGMWSGTDERYAVGQRMLLMLHAPNAQGLSSPVGGPDGVMPVRGGGGTVGEQDGTTAVQAAVVDLRWVGAKLGRPVVYQSEMPRPGMAGGRRPDAAGVGVLVAPRGVTAGLGVIGVGAEMAGLRPRSREEVAAAPTASVPAQEASVANLMSLFGSWEAGLAK